MNQLKQAALCVGMMVVWGGAVAQPSVEVYGVVDLAVQRVDNGSKALSAVVSNANNLASRLGFRGSEDLGGGLTAKFTLESGLNPDTGSQGDPARFFNRMAFVGLQGTAGELRLGHDYTPTYRQLALLDPFGTNGLAKILTFVPALSDQTTTVRTDNGLQYLLPGAKLFGGTVSGELMYALNERNSAAPVSNHFSGERLAYNIGAFTLSAAHGESKVTAVSGVNTVKETYLGGKYVLDGASLGLQWGERKLGSDKRRFVQLAAIMPITSSDAVKASLVHYSRTGTDLGADMIGLGATHDLSKRTQLYGTFARLINENNSALGLGGLAGVAGKSVTGIEAGMRHSF